VNDGDQALSLIYLVGCLILVGSAIAVRRIPMVSSLKIIAAWLLIFVAAFAVFTLKDDFLDRGPRRRPCGRGPRSTAHRTGRRYGTHTPVQRRPFLGQC